MKGLLKLLLGLLATLLGLSLLYVGLAALLAYIPVNAQVPAPSKEVEIYITTNGVHADFTLPVQTPVVNWRRHFPLQEYAGAKSSDQYIAFGWGDRGFYLDTPQWSDLTASTAIEALFLPSPTAMHVTYYQQAPSPATDSRRLYLSEAQYRQLVRYIQKSFASTIDGDFLLIKGAGYSPYDNFYEANGSYSLFYTCNNWVNEGLKEIGVKTAVWAPFDWGVLHHLEEE